MSRYTGAWLWTYGVSAVLLLVAIGIWFLVGWRTLPYNVIDGVVGVLFGMVYFLAACFWFVRGCRNLAGDHWRAEDYRP